MLKLESLLAFVSAAEASSISEAARRLQISKSVASERIAELERSIGATLMHRSTRKLALTEDGVAFLERAKRILREASDATTEIAERRGELTGPLRISAPVSFGILHLGPALNSFLGKNPRVDLSVELDDHFVGAADGFDAVIRHGPLPDNRWIAKRFAVGRRVLVTSPEYLKQNGTPRTVADLEHHRGIIYSIRGMSDWRFRQSGRWRVVRPAAIMRVNNGIVMREAAQQGLGIALLATFVVHDLVAAKKLRVVEIDAEAESASIIFAYPSERRASAKVTALIAHLRASFGSPPYWDRELDDGR
jgi:DNA-binding transcriptional LysR family regulator